MSKAKWISRIFCCLVLLASWVHGEDHEKIIVQTPFTPVKKVFPGYPENLKKEGIPARFLIWINIDRKGNVIRAWIANSLYPELEENIEKAFAQWKFEPYIHEGEPIRTFGFLTVIFYPGHMSLPSKTSEPGIITPEEDFALPAEEELQIVLDRCTEYCLKLSESALFYICDERIKETLKSINGSDRVYFSPPQAINSTFEILGAGHDALSLGDTERHTYIYDYQLIREKGEIEEKRILMEKDRKQAGFEDVPRGTMPSYSLKSILIPVQLLGIEQRSKFSFRLAEDDKIRGKPAYVLEASLRPGHTGNIKKGRIWVDKSDFRVLRAEIETVFVEGFEQVIAECNRYYLRPHFKSTHDYGIEKNGLLFPDRSEIRCEYSGFLRTKKDLKSEVEITYQDYKFFTVETDHEVIKKKLEALFLHRSQQKFEYLLRSFPDIIKYY